MAEGMSIQKETVLVSSTYIQNMYKKCLRSAFLEYVEMEETFSVWNCYSEELL